jgi:hypothetical protein
MRQYPRHRAQARADALGRDGELACFPTAVRWNRVLELLGSDALDPYAGLWIGASDAAAEGTWTWVNGEAFVFKQWATGKPGTAEGNTLDYAEVGGGDSSGEIGKWYPRIQGTLGVRHEHWDRPVQISLAAGQDLFSARIDRSGGLDPDRDWHHRDGRDTHADLFLGRSTQTVVPGQEGVALRRGSHPTLLMSA